MSEKNPLFEMLDIKTGIDKKTGEAVIWGDATYVTFDPLVREHMLPQEREAFDKELARRTADIMSDQIKRGALKKKKAPDSTT